MRAGLITDIMLYEFYIFALDISLVLDIIDRKLTGHILFFRKIDLGKPK